MITCRYCNQLILPGEEVKTLSYWQALPFMAHARCRESGERQEAIECQTLDADCNDCRHYRRGTLAPKVISTWINERGKLATIVHQPNVFLGGHCLKFDRSTLAFPKKFTGWECFEHRRLA